VPRLIWTPNALADVQRLYRWLLPKDAEAATRAYRPSGGGYGSKRECDDADRDHQSGL
jgi:hypothetical protein